MVNLDNVKGKDYVDLEFQTKERYFNCYKCNKPIIMFKSSEPEVLLGETVYKLEEMYSYDKNTNKLMRIKSYSIDEDNKEIKIYK